MIRFSEKATLIEITNNGQKYQTEKGRIIWLRGDTAAKNVNVGDTGILQYKITLTYGLWFFEKDK